MPGIGTKPQLSCSISFQPLRSVIPIWTSRSSVASRLKEYEEQALLKQKLATIALDVPVKVDFSELKVEEPDYEALIELFQQA